MIQLAGVMAWGGQRVANENLSSEDRTALERLLWVLETIREIKANMPVHMLAAFIRVALHEGKSVAELTKDAGVAQSVMSRALLDLGPMTRDREPGLGLVEHRLSPVNMKQHEIALTRPGIALARKIAGMLSLKRK